MIEQGIFHVAKEELRAIRCPFGCGEMESIALIQKADGTTEHFVSCSEGEGEVVLEPEQYQLMAFVPNVYLQCAANGFKIKGKEHKKRRARPRDTKWIKMERKAVLEYANDPKRNKSNLLPYEVCDIVWRLNAYEFEAAARLPPNERGYKNAQALRAYFYRSYKRKSAIVITTFPTHETMRLTA